MAAGGSDDVIREQLTVVVAFGLVIEVLAGA